MQRAQYDPPSITQPINLSLAQQYFDTLPEHDINRKYYEGLEYTKPWNKYDIFYYLNTLEKFYPYQKTVKNTKTQLDEDINAYRFNAGLFTLASWTFIFQYAKRGRVVPLLSEYGSLFQTHRLFRHYLYTLAIPIAIAEFELRHKYADHVQALWKVHVQRLNKKILTDPGFTEYPEELKAPIRDVFVRKRF